MRHTRARARHGHLHTSLAVATLALIAAAALASCSQTSDSSAQQSVSVSGGTSGAFSGDRLDKSVTLDKSARTDRFQSSAGGTETVGALQQHKLMLLYFGYTHCPDVCPTTMANLGSALRQLPTQEQAHVQVVFVTSDPDRDTPPVMKSWLANFDPGLPVPFVGLTASIKQIDGVATSVGIPLEPPVKHADGTITVEHGAQTLAFADGAAHVLWTAGTTPGQYAHDIPMLLRGRAGDPVS